MSNIKEEYMGLIDRVTKIAGDLCIRSTMADYLKKYYLTEFEYNQSFRSIKERIFLEGGPSIDRFGMFLNNYCCSVADGGILFAEDEFCEINKDMMKNGENYIVIIEDDSGEREPFRMRYPVGLSWAELKSGDCISFELFERPIRKYYVFVESGRWAKYVNNDADDPFEIIGLLK